MTYPKDDNGRYSIPVCPDEVRVEVDCAGCGDGWNVPERVWDWFSFCHAREHRKGHNGLTAVADTDVRRFEPEREAG